MPRRLFVAAFLVAHLATGASPAVAQVNSHGFLVKHEASIDAPPKQVYDALVGQVGLWWDSAHTFSGDAKNLSIDARPGGCFCERLPDGGGVEHLRVVHAAPGKLLRMSGALGPLQASGLAGSMTWTLTSASDGTVVGLMYSVGGFMEGDFETIAPAVEAVLGEQLRRLELFIETGKATQEPGS